MQITDNNDRLLVDKSNFSRIPITIIWRDKRIFTEILSKVFEVIYIVSAKICSSIRFSFQLLRVIEEEGTLFYKKYSVSILHIFAYYVHFAYTLASSKNPQSNLR